jgi:hypothetical protein
MVNRDELDTTVTRMEQHLAQSSNPSIQILLQAYHQLKSRFRIGLVDERDYLLSCGGALMLIQYIAQQKAADTPET